MSWINTMSGVKFSPLAEEPGEIRLEDIAHSLGNLCRYNGHTRVFYSVAEHCVRLASHALDEHADERLARYLLLHDASEAYLGDIVRPLKYGPEFDRYREVERQLQAKIYLRFRLDPGMVPAKVFEWDSRIIANESKALFRENHHPDWKSPEPLNLRENVWYWGWSPDITKNTFLRIAEKLDLR